MKKFFALLAAVVLFAACTNVTKPSTEESVVTDTTMVEAVDTVTVDTTVVAE